MLHSRIRRLRVRAVRVPITPPHQTASGQLTEAPLVLTDLVTADSIVGHSIVFTYKAAALKPTADLIRNLEPAIAGDELAPVEIAEKLARQFRLLGTQGLVGMALAAIDMAAWDALARVHETSLVRLLGGDAKPIQAYGAIGYDGPAACARSAEAWAKKGFRGVKVKIGYPTVAGDLAVIRAIRQAGGESIAVMADYNQSLSPAEAAERLRVLDYEGLTWVEEPTMAHDYAGHARIAHDAKTPIQCGENWWGITDLQHAIDAHASDFIMPDVMKIGGVTGWMRASAIAASHGLRMSNHLWPEISAQLLSVTPTAHWLEYVDWWNPILAQPIEVVDGVVDAAGASGSGITWNENAVSRFTE